MKIYVVVEDEYNPDILLVTVNLEKAKDFVSEKELWVQVWEKDEEVDSLNFKVFKETY